MESLKSLAENRGNCCAIAEKNVWETNDGPNPFRCLLRYFHECRNTKLNKDSTVQTSNVGALVSIPIIIHTDNSALGKHTQIHWNTEPKACNYIISKQPILRFSSRKHTRHFHEFVMSNSETDILLQRVMQIYRPCDIVASLSPCHSSNMSAKLRPSGSNAINWRCCAFVAAYDEGCEGPAWFIKGCSACGQWLENGWSITTRAPK